MKSTTLLALGLLFAPLSEASPYFIFEAGNGKADLSSPAFNAFNDTLIAAGGSASLSEEESSRVFITGLGWQHNEQWHTQLLYMNLGDRSAQSTSSDSEAGITRNRQITERVEQQGIALNLTAQWRWQANWSLQPSLGVVLLQQKSSGEATGSTLNAIGEVVEREQQQASATNRSLVPLLGVGLAYQINPDWQGQLTARRLFNLDPEMLEKHDLTLITLGVSYRFILGE